MIEHAKEYDGKIIEFQGEAVGDVMVRRHGTWINIKDANNAIGVWMDMDISGWITYTGSYGYSGDMLLVEGKFNRACSVHGGDLDIHATDIRIVKQGHKVDRGISSGKLSTAVILSVLACGLMAAEFIYGRRNKASAK
ncbi:MAG: DNA-binding protein [Candidatus Omnitrophota bacterium]